MVKCTYIHGFTAKPKCGLIKHSNIRYSRHHKYMKCKTRLVFLWTRIQTRYQIQYKQKY